MGWAWVWGVLGRSHSSSLGLKMELNCISLDVAREEEQGVEGSPMYRDTDTPKGLWDSGRGGESGKW